MSVLSDEAGIFLIMAGIYSGGIASIDVFLQGHSGTPMRVDRADRVAHIDKPALSFGLALQPGVLSDVASNRRFRDSGLLARFLFAIPESNVGRRTLRQRTAIPPLVSTEYARQLHGLLEGCNQAVTKPHVLPMTDAAREVWLNFSDEIERQIGENGELESISDWACKLPGAAARIAGLLELAEIGIRTEDISQVSTEMAVKLCRLLIQHALAAFGLLGADTTDIDADSIVKWARSGRHVSFTKRQCHKSLEGRFRSVSRLDSALERLRLSDALRFEKIPNKRGIPTTMIHMNQRLFGDIVDIVDNV
jgi:putative DNA primase/helicase